MNEQLQDRFGVIEPPGTLVIRRWLPGPAARVWRYLTDSDLRRKWLAAGEMDLTPGADFELVWRNDDLSTASDPRPEGFPEEARATMRMVAVEPPHLLIFTWGSGEVAIRLEERGDRVLLTLTHMGLTDPAQRLMVAAGWHTHLDILVANTAGGSAPSFWGEWLRLRGEYAARLPG